MGNKKKRLERHLKNKENDSKVKNESRLAGKYIRENNNHFKYSKEFTNNAANYFINILNERLKEIDCNDKEQFNKLIMYYREDIIDLLIYWGSEKTISYDCLKGAIDRYYSNKEYLELFKKYSNISIEQYKMSPIDSVAYKLAGFRPDGKGSTVYVREVLESINNRSGWIYETWKDSIDTHIKRKIKDDK